LNFIQRTDKINIALTCYVNFVYALNKVQRYV